MPDAHTKYARRLKSILYCTKRVKKVERELKGRF